MPQPFGFIEYPKWVMPPGGVPCVVQSAEQEAAAMAAPQPEPSAPTEPPTPSDEKEALRQRARDLGLTVDGRWSADRLRLEIETVSPGPTSPQPEDTPA